MSAKTQEKRRYWTKAQKEEILRAYDRGSCSLADFSRKHQIHPVTLYKWRRQMIQQKTPITDPSPHEILIELEQTKKENEHLKKAVGELAVDKQILQTANEILKKRRNQALYPSRKRRFKSKAQQ